MANITEVDRSRLILAPEANFPTQDFELTQIRHGLVVCRSKILSDRNPIRSALGDFNQLSKTESGIMLASNDERLAKVAAKKGLIIPTDEQIMKFAEAPTAEEPPKRSSAELARAIFNPYLFLAGEVSKKLEKSELPKLCEVIKNLETSGSDSNRRLPYSIGATKRVKRKVKFYDKKSDSVEFIEKSVPGALETTALTIMLLLKEPAFRSDYNMIVLDPLNLLIGNYRAQTRNSRELPEMPDLTNELIESLDVFNTVPAIRQEIYSILEQIKIPYSQLEILAQKMDAVGDLDHPLAFQATLAIAKNNPDSPWILAQKERREALLEALSGTNQEMFNNYQQLLSLSQGLVYHGDPLNPEPGKVSLEIEFTKTIPWKLRVELDGRNTRTRFDRWCHRHGMEKCWFVDFDEYNGKTNEYNKEIKRKDDSLSHNQEFVESFVPLYKWFGDHARELLSLHLHFDREQHPNRPTLGNLFFYYTEEIKRNDLGTWEVRCLNLPRTKGKIQPARIEDLIGLYINATKEGYTPDPEQKIVIPEDVTVDQALFGHICSFIKKPQGRLAALMTLHDSMALKNFTPHAFANSFEQSSLVKIIEKVKAVVKGKDLKQLSVLSAFAEGKLEPYDPHSSENELDNFDVSFFEAVIGRGILRVPSKAPETHFVPPERFPIIAPETHIPSDRIFLTPEILRNFRYPGNVFDDRFPDNHLNDRRIEPLIPRNREEFPLERLEISEPIYSRNRELPISFLPLNQTSFRQYFNIREFPRINLINNFQPIFNRENLPSLIESFPNNPIAEESNSTFRSRIMDILRRLRGESPTNPENNP